MRTRKKVYPQQEQEPDRTINKTAPRSLGGHNYNSTDQNELSNFYSQLYNIVPTLKNIVLHT